MGSFLMRLARSLFQGAQKSLSQLTNVVQEQVEGVVKQQIMGIMDQVWRGKGAAKFTEEINSIAMPKVGSLIQVFMNHNNNLTKAREILDRAENEAKNKIATLADPFKFF